jgi:hypothetical protein
LHGFAERGHLASHLKLLPSNDGVLPFDDFAHALELASLGVTSSLVAKQFDFLGVGLFELNALGFCLLNHFGTGRFQQLAVGGLFNGFFLHRGVHDHTGQFFLVNQIEGTATSMVLASSPTTLSSLKFFGSTQIGWGRMATGARNARCHKSIARWGG